MTECERFVKEEVFKQSESERILKKWNISPDYIKEEVKNDFLIETFRKKLWLVELDLLKEIDRVCKKYNLKYFLFFGSLLGAIRHKGFIPWDDDIDIIMPRNDYQEFIKHGDEFDTPYFLQNCETDKDFFYVHSRLRNSNTTAIQRPFAERDFNHGVFLDILYYDEFDCGDEGRQTFSELNSLTKKLSIYMKLTNPFPNNCDKALIAAYEGENPKELFDRIQQLSQSFNGKGMNHVVSTSAQIYGFDRCCFLKEDFEEQEWVDFEDFKFPVPVGWKRILITTYGDYNKLPTEISRGTWHGSIWFDLDKSYEEVKQEVEYKEWMKKGY